MHSSRATVGVPKETGHYEPVSTADLNNGMLGRSEERWQCTVKVGYQVAPGIRSRDFYSMMWSIRAYWCAKASRQIDFLWAVQ
jgi:hypothetical protein